MKNLDEVRGVLYDAVSMFFSRASVMWSEQVMTIPQLPYVTMKLGNLQKSLFPVVVDGIRQYQCSVVLELNLYTKGMPVTVSENATGNYSNTAVSDLNGFCMFLESDFIVDIIAGKGMSIDLIPPIRDLSELMNDRYRYRSMAEFNVSYSQESEGLYGIYGIDNYSGGSYSFALAEDSAIDEVKITEVNNEE